MQDGIEARAALPIDGHRRRRQRQARGKRDQPGWVAALAGVADDDFLDVFVGKPRIGQGRCDHRSGQILDAPIAMQSADAAECATARSHEIGP